VTGLAAVANPFTSDERQRIDDAIQTIEQSTGAALNFMMNRASDRYLLYPLIWAGCGALLATVLVALMWPNLDDRETILIEVSILIALMLVFDWLPIRMWLVPARIKHAQARQLAHRRFADHVAADNLHRGRILLFVSLGEHYVEIIADHATHALVPGSVWNAIVDEFVAAIQTGRVAEGALTALTACGGILEEGHCGHSSNKSKN
jgi:putative membrane protein